jgi:hypothetical protein
MNVFAQNHALIVQRQSMIEGFPFQAIEKVYAQYDNVNFQWLVVVKFYSDRGCSEDKLLLRLSDIGNQPTWTDSTSGVTVAITDILSWIQPLSAGLASEATLVSIDAGIPSSLGQKVMSQSMPVVIASNQSNGNTVPNYIRVTGVGTVAPVTTSFSVKNIGNANGTFLGEVLKAGEPALNFDAGTYRSYISNAFTYDATGTEFLIIYNS